MGRRNKKGRDITGIIIVDKPTGRSSNHVLQQVKRLFDAKKAGHTGSLDPLATGVLPICLGEATKVSSYLLDADKQYHVTCKLGIITDSGDSDGTVIETLAVPEFTAESLHVVLEQFTGLQQQVPPMYSALKHQGQPLYKLARQGIEVERKPREVTIYSIDLLEITDDSFTLAVTCSKGTYIRTLVEDICHAMKTGGHVVMLRRVQSAGYKIDQALTIEQLEAMSEQDLAELDQNLLETADALPSWPKIVMEEHEVQALRMGQYVQSNTRYVQTQVRLFDTRDQFLGLGAMSEDGVVAPKRVFVVNKQG